MFIFVIKACFVVVNMFSRCWAHQIMIHCYDKYSAATKTLTVDKYLIVWDTLTETVLENNIYIMNTVM